MFRKLFQLARLASGRALEYTVAMGRYIVVFFILCLAAPLAGCGTASSDGRLYSHDYQPESPSRAPGHNLYAADALDNSAAQRANMFSRSETSHVRQQTFVQGLMEKQALDEAARKVGREPGSLFRR